MQKAFKLVTKKPISDVRFGFYSTSSTHRIPKSKKCKIRKHCPVTIQMTENDTYVTFLHNKTRVSHDLDIKYKKIDKTDKEIIKYVYFFNVYLLHICYHLFPFMQ